MMKINENEMAKFIAEIEGKQQELSIAQIKEVMRCCLRRLSSEWKNGNEAGVIELLKKHSPVELE